MLAEHITYFEQACNLLNKRFFEGTLSKVIITIQSSPKTYGHFTTGRIWVTDTQGNGHYEINLSAEYINRPIENTLATLLHEMVHQYCAENNIKDTSRGGTYHNKRFATECEKRGLHISYDKKIGWSITEPAEDLIDYIEESDLRSTIPFHRATMTVSRKKKKSSTRKYYCPCCGQSVRATKEVNITCGDCQETMICDNNDDESED